MQNTKVVDVSLCHEYFNGSACGLKVIPSSKTAEILKNEHSQCRIYDGKVKLIAPLDAFRCESVLFFYVKASIAEVWNVTCFDGIAYDKFPVVVVSENGNVAFVGRDKRSVPNLDRMFGVIFGLEIHVGPSRKFECTVTIPTKKMRWGYCFSGSYAERNLQINDSLKADDPVQFDCGKNVAFFALRVAARNPDCERGASAVSTAGFRYVQSAYQETPERECQVFYQGSTGRRDSDDCRGMFSRSLNVV